MHQNISKIFSRNATYGEMIEVCCKYSEAGKSNIYLGSYEGKKLENKVETLQGYALAQKEKKDLSECVCITHKMIFSSCQSQR